VPFNSIPAKDFINRERELAYLKLLTEVRDRAIADNILLQGPRGIGKTELLKQFYRTVFWEEKKVLPFYYSFQKATLKASYFAKDYLTRFVRQYLAYVKKNPSFIDSMGTPLVGLMPDFSSLRLDWLINLIEDFQSLLKNGDTYEQMLAAISAPVTTARESGMPVIIMLDDFPMAAHLYETNQGDAPGLMSLFEGPMKTSICPHVLTGSPDGLLESIFADNAFRGKAERMFIKELPEDAAQTLFGSLCDKLGVRNDREASLSFVRLLEGNPLYIRNMAKAIWKMNKKEISEKDLWEGYGFEVSEGETAFYWSSVLGEFLGDPGLLRVAVDLLMHMTKSDSRSHDFPRLSRVLGIPESSLRSAFDGLKMAGIVQGTGDAGQLRDGVLKDFIQSRYMRDAEGKSPERVRELIGAKYYPVRDAGASFAMTIPMAPDAELVVAKAFEQIGKNIRMDPEVVKQIQLALIESCINAFEHSGSYEKEVFIKITTSRSRLEIITESPGKFFDPEKAEEPDIEEKLHAENKRGWGLRLMKKIMDEVKVERMGDNTRVILIKNIASDEVLK
jgi:anti-sigma regulatory factor (Ser/Thr protein kinase)